MVSDVSPERAFDGIPLTFTDVAPVKSEAVPYSRTQLVAEPLSVQLNVAPVAVILDAVRLIGLRQVGATRTLMSSTNQYHDEEPELCLKAK